MRRIATPCNRCSDGFSPEYHEETGGRCPHAKPSTHSGVCFVCGQGHCLCPLVPDGESHEA